MARLITRKGGARRGKDSTVWERIGTAWFYGPERATLKGFLIKMERRGKDRRGKDRIGVDRLG